MAKTKGRSGATTNSSKRAHSPLRSINIDRNSVSGPRKDVWSLELVTQPKHIFYKDEGGKANHLFGVLRLVRKDGLVASFDAEGVKRIKTLLRFVLCFASKKEVEDGDEIFTAREVSPYPAKSDEWENGKVSEFLFKFRIDKVSRRKDGQHFSVRCELKTHESIVDGAEVGCCYTSAVNVLSKRKSRSNAGSVGRPRSNSLSSNSSSRSSNKRARTSRKDAAKLDAVLRRLDKVESEVVRLKQKNAALEKALRKNAKLVARLSRPPSMSALLGDPHLDFEDAAGGSFEEKCAKVYSPEGPSAISFGQSQGSTSDMSPLNAMGKTASSQSSDIPVLKRAGSLESISSHAWANSWSKLEPLVL